MMLKFQPSQMLDYNRVCLEPRENSLCSLILCVIADYNIYFYVS